MQSIKKSNDSPKTPGGISKSYLTPIRRVGLSRKWRKSGSSPFISPLSGLSNGPETPKPEKVSRKRRKISNNEDEQSTEINLSDDTITTSSVHCTTPVSGISRTPSRNLLPKKTSKTLILINDCVEENKNEPDNSKLIDNVKHNCDAVISDSPDITNAIVINPSSCTPKNKIGSSPKTKSKKVTQVVCQMNENLIKDSEKIKQKSPNNLTKECVVVIQKKIFNAINVDTNEHEDTKIKKVEVNLVSQVLFDSDSEDVPLCNLNKDENTCVNKLIKDDDFQENKARVKNISHDKIVRESKKPKKDKTNSKVTKPLTIKIDSTPSSQSSNSYEDDDDFQFEKKKTTLVKKSYGKITKPVKAKSTGSITQQDIDEMKKRIEKKTKLLLAKAMTQETSELRGLIKKWQKGCQNALTELLELMKKKMPEKQNMEYSEILQILKIPPNLVGYDSENDCFITPDDTNIVLSSLNI